MRFAGIVLISWLGLAVEVGAEEGRIAAIIDSLTAHDSRVVGYLGCARAADFIERELHLAGLEEVQREEFPVVVPIDKGGRLRIAASEESFQLWGLWPNQVLTSTLPAMGLTAPMVYGGTGEFEEFGGSAMDGRIVLMEFASWGHWLRAAGLGARAVVFIEPDDPSWRQAEAKFAQLPLDIPRFWIAREAGTALRRKLEKGELLVELEARMEWQERPAWNIWGMVPGTDPELRQETIAIEAYYDGISVVPGLAPSAETACSITGLMELARHLRDSPPKRSVLLLATSAHFQARQGIVDFLNRHARRHPHYIDKMESDAGIDLFISLDLSSHSNQIGIWNNTQRQDLKRFFAPLGRAFLRYAARVGSEANLVNGITPVKGLEWADYVPDGLLINSQTALRAGLISLALVSVNDGRFGVDLPLDRIERMDLGNLAGQIHLLKGVLTQAFDDPELLANRRDFLPVLKDELRNLNIQVRAMPRRSQIPDRSVAGAVVALKPAPDLGKTLKGVRNIRIYKSDDRGDVEIPGLALGQHAVTAHVLDPASGGIRYAPDLSTRASKFHREARADGWLTASVQWPDDKKPIVVFPCLAAPFYGLADPRFLSDISAIKIISPGDVAPRQFGYALGANQAERAAVVFVTPGAESENRIKILLGGRLLLLNNQHVDAGPAGEGYLLGQDSLVPTLPKVVGDMWRLDDARLELMRDHAIESQHFAHLHRQAGRFLADAHDAAASFDWARFVAYMRTALGLEALVYPALKAALNDVISGIVFFLALAVPAAFLGERLVLAAADIRRQLAGFGFVLLLIWLVIAQVHPAFAIAHPLVVLLSFAIMAMSLFTLFLLGTRFNRHMKTHGFEIHQADLGRLSATYTAFMLGISNMRRRKLRTGLTLSTLVLLTFTVLAFTSFKSELRSIAIPLEHQGSYQGLLVRDRGWRQLDQLMLDYVRSHFQDSAKIAPRNWLILKERKKASLEIASGRRSVKAYALLGLVPEEIGITGLDRALSEGRFFNRSDEASCLLPAKMAEALGLGPEDVDRARVRVLGKELTVRGIIDAEFMHRIRDLDDGLLTPVDFELSQNVEALFGSGDRSLAESVSTEYRPYTHLLPDNVLIAPHATVREMGGTLRSIAIGIENRAEVRPLLDAFLLRVAVSLFAGLSQPDQEGIEVFAYSSVGTPVVKGLGALIIPMCIGILIVINTMMGAVYERHREIGIYSSVGLSPLHIALLFLAEACAYAILGITLGYLLGQGVGLFLSKAGYLEGLQLNYSSIAAITSALAVMAVVLLSTLYPARIAARLAVPDVVRRWSPPAPVGSVWSFRFPFMISRLDAEGFCDFLCEYLSASTQMGSSSFQASATVMHSFPAELGPAWAVESKVWLHPLELGVTQHLVLCVVPEEEDGTCALIFQLRCLSGDNDSWRRTNRHFLQAIRMELLIWNNLKDQDKARYRERGRVAMG